MSAEVVVVGAGFAGLAAACHLRGLGHEVCVVEAAEVAGGRAGVVQHGPYRFDTGPTVVTMRPLLERCAAAVDAELDDLCELRPLDPVYAGHFPSGRGFAVRATPDATAADIEAAFGRAEAEGYRRFVSWLAELHDVEFDHFIDRDIEGIRSLVDRAGQLVDLARIGGFRSWQSNVARHLRAPELRKLFSFQAMYAGISPVDALGLFAVIAHMDTVAGVHAPVGGTAAIADGLVGAAEKAGVEFRFGTRVERIDANDLHGPRLRLDDGEELRPAAAVVTVDLPLVYADLVGIDPPRAVRRAVTSPSCVVWHLATTGPLPAGTAHHNVHFGSAWESSFAELFERRVPMTDPSRFVTVATCSDPTAGPPGGAPLFVLEPVPDLGADLDWSRVTPRLTERMRTWASEVGYPVDGAELVSVIDPPAWRAQGAAAGTPFSFAHRFLQSGPFRPAPTDRRLPGVVLAGAGTRPGVGVPMVLISGRIAAERVDGMLTGRAS